MLAAAEISLWLVEQSWEIMLVVLLTIAFERVAMCLFKESLKVTLNIFNMSESKKR